MTDSTGRAGDTTDPVAAALDAMEDRNEQYISAMRLTEATVATWPSGDLRCAVAALREVLGVASRWEREDLATQLRATISRALLGEEAANG